MVTKDNQIKVQHKGWSAISTEMTQWNFAKTSKSYNLTIYDDKGNSRLDIATKEMLGKKELRLLLRKLMYGEGNI